MRRRRRNEPLCTAIHPRLPHLFLSFYSIMELHMAPLLTLGLLTGSPSIQQYWPELPPPT